jgi:hypothetical protein
MSELKMNIVSEKCVGTLAMEFLTVAQEAAIAAYPWVGKGNKNEADAAGTEAMRNRMNLVDMDGLIVIGEGEMDEAPMLYIDEKLGTDKGPQVDIAVDPVDGTTAMSKGKDNSMSVLAVSSRGSLLHAPDMYMKKIAVGLTSILLASFLLGGCATSRKVNIVQAGDHRLPCDQLMAELEKLDQAEQEVESKKGVTGTNVSAALFCLPWLAYTYYYAGQAVGAINDRRAHLTKLYNDQDC